MGILTARRDDAGTARADAAWTVLHHHAWHRPAGRPLPATGSGEMVEGHGHAWQAMDLRDDGLDDMLLMGG